MATLRFALGEKVADWANLTQSIGAPHLLLWENEGALIWVVESSGFFSTFLLFDRALNLIEKLRGVPRSKT